VKKFANYVQYEQCVWHEEMCFIGWLDLTDRQTVQWGFRVSVHAVSL